VENTRPTPPGANCDLDKSAPVARDRYQESRRAIRIGGVGVRERGILAWSMGPASAASGIWSSPAREAGGAEDRLWNSGHRDRFGRWLWSR
jgi:hypothetical protein